MKRPDALVPCMACGRLTEIDLLDAKPEPGCDPDTADWTRLECEGCYGDGWSPGGGIIMASSWTGRTALETKP